MKPMGECLISCRPIITDVRLFGVLVAVVVLTSCILLISWKLFSEKPVQIVFETGEVSTTSPDYFPVADVLLMVSCSFLIGASSVYIYYASETKELISSLREKKDLKKDYSLIASLLKGDEKNVFLKLVDSGGEILQNKLVLESGLSKVKVTRVLSRLEKKNILYKERYGLTNKIRIKNKPE